MKIHVALLIVTLAFSSASFVQTTRPIPPGIREADKLPGPADIPPLNQSKFHGPASELLQGQARDLALLAQTIPEAIAQVNRGTLPKDINEKLKRIEKLSKTLREEIGK